MENIENYDKGHDEFIYDRFSYFCCKNFLLDKKIKPVLLVSITI